jgi:uncharacterized peroxidase-related enzyme
MPFLGSLPDDANLGRLYTTDPAYFMPLVEFSENVMRGPSPLSPGQREFIAAYVSGLNTCAFCAGAHEAAASAFEIDSDIFAELMEDIETARVEENFKPILRYAKKLTLTPSRLVQGDADAVFNAGWGEEALSHAINVCALFNYFNRIVDGHGLRVDPSENEERGKMLASVGYLSMHGPRLQKLMDEKS